MGGAVLCAVLTRLSAVKQGKNMGAVQVSLWFDPNALPDDSDADDEEEDKTVGGVARTAVMRCGALGLLDSLHRSFTRWRTGVRPVQAGGASRATPNVAACGDWAADGGRGGC